MLAAQALCTQQRLISNEAFLNEQQRGHVAVIGSQSLHTHRCLHGSNNTQASFSPHTPQTRLRLAATSVRSSDPSTQHDDWASSASWPSQPPAADLSAMVEIAWSSFVWSAVATASLFLAASNQTTISELICINLSSNWQFLRLAISSSVSLSINRAITCCLIARIKLLDRRFHVSSNPNKSFSF